MARIPFQVDPSELLDFDPRSFAGLCASLLLSELRKSGADTNCLDSSVRQSVADGGIDAKINPGKKRIKSERLPARISVWHFKSGRGTWTKKYWEAEVRAKEVAGRRDGRRGEETELG
jgi:hypothetical protein